MKSKKHLKGMTLVEIIIAMAILAIAGSVMCTACSLVSKMKLTTNSLTKRISYEAPIADCKIYQVKSYDELGNEVITDYATPIGTEYNKYKYDADGKVISSETKVCNNNLVVDDGINLPYTVDGYLYQADYNGSTYGGENGITGDSVNNHNFKFFVVGGIDTP